MNKFLILLLFIAPVPAQAQGPMDGFMKLFNSKPPQQPKGQTSYKFIQPPKDKKLGNFRVTCFSPSGASLPDITNLQIKQIETNFTNYTFLTLDNKSVLAPIDFCFIIQN